MGDSIARKLSIIGTLIALSCGVNTGNSPVTDISDSNLQVKVSTCRSDKDCDKGQGCSGSPGICVPTARSETYDIQITPPVSSDYLPVQFAGVSLTGSPVRFTMAGPVELTGSAAIQSKSGITVISGLLIAQATSVIPFITQRSETKVSSTMAMDGTTFRIKLSPGIEYNFAFIPDVQGLPPYTFTDTLIRSTEKNILLPSKYQRIEGVVSYHTDSGKLGISNALVQSSWDSFVGGTQTKTDKNGYFSLLLPSQITSVKLNIKAGKTYYFNPISLQVDMQSRNLLKISVTDFRPVHSMAIQVVGNNGQTVVKHALVTVVSQKDPVVASGITDSSGIVRLDVPEGDFLLDVISPGNSPFESAIFKLKVISDVNQPFVVMLDKRPCVEGNVNNSIDLSNIADAQVILIPSSDAGTHGVQFSDVTGPDGQFRLCVDPGDYSLIVDPPQDSGLARFSSQVKLGSPFKALDISLPSGVLVRGIIQGENGSPIPGARVDFFFKSLNDVHNLSAMSLPYTTALAATTVTDYQGNFSIIVPHIGLNSE